MNFIPQLWEGSAEERLLPPWEIVQRGLSFDRGWYIGLSRLSFLSPTLGRIEVPERQITDHASIPWAMLGQLCRDHPVIAFGSKIHDYLCACRGVLPDGRTYTIDQANRILAFECMESCGATDLQKSGVYHALSSPFAFKF